MADINQNLNNDNMDIDEKIISDKDNSISNGNNNFGLSEITHKNENTDNQESTIDTHPKKKSSHKFHPFKIIFSFPVGLFFLFISLFFFVIDYYNSKDYYEPEFEIFDNYKSPNFVAISKEGRRAVIDNQNRIILHEENFYKTLSLKDLGYNSLEATIISACFDDYNNLYFYYTVYSDDSYVTAYDKIGKIDYNGNYVDDVISFDYRNNENCYKRTANIIGLNADKDTINFLYKKSDFDIYEYSYDIRNDGYTVSDKFVLNDYVTVVNGCFAKDEGYAVILNNGDIGYLKDGSFKLLINDDFKYGEDPYLSFLPIELVYSNKTLYCISGSGYDNIVKIEEGKYDYLNNVYEIGDAFDFNYLYDEYTYYNVHLFDNNNKLGLVAGDVIVYDINNSDLFYDSGDHLLPLYKIIILFFISNTSIFFPAFLILGIIITFGAFVKWKMSILTKQLLLTLPPIVIAFVIFAFIAMFSIYDVFIEQTYNNMDAITSIAAMSFDVNELKEIKDYDYVSSGKEWEYHKKLEEILANNEDDWSKKLELRLFLITQNDEQIGFQEIASSSEYGKPFSKYTYSNDSPELSDVNIGKLNMTYSSPYMTYELYDHSIFDENGNLIAIVEISGDDSDLDKIIDPILFRFLALMLIFTGILTFVISVFSYFNVKKIQMASDTVSEIAKGDFGIRIKKTGNDEIGEICRGVNDMADKLDTLFKEKDENEQFYYKFVPEQFKDLLHKDKFTELSLGDAESIDLTVLFCDIRSFSISSEMMTAKENFEFINIIFGIAGPIIRKHNGFVDKYIGDAVMALFESADDAIECGKEMYREIVLNPQTAKNLNISSINVGIGIHTGMARIGIIGEEERMSGTVISNTVNLSSRLESLTKQYDTAMIISKSTLDHITDPDSINTRYLGMVQVAGVNEVTGLYEVLDCLDETRFNERMQYKSDFREAVRLYHMGDLEGALSKFESIKTDRKLDPALDKYINYIKEMIDTGSKDSNVFRFSRK